MSQPSQNTITTSTNKSESLEYRQNCTLQKLCRAKGRSRILARGVQMSDGNAQEAQSLFVRQCIIHAFKRVRAVV